MLMRGPIHQEDSHWREMGYKAALMANDIPFDERLVLNGDFERHTAYQTLSRFIAAENQVPFEILKPLIQETAEKINTLTPEEAQTGPAKRHDSKTITAHELFLTNKNQSTIYKILTQSIQDNGKKL